MEVRLNDGLYRHVVFKQPGTVCMMFSLTTTPGRLVYAGDMGCFVFQRLEDMFAFFRSKEGREPNYGYWHEKLVAVDRQGSEEKSHERFRENLERYVKDDDTLIDERRAEVEEFIEQAVDEYQESGPECAWRSVMDFSLEPQEKYKTRTQFFQDFWECSDTVFTFRYLWACHAIQWGISKFDAASK
jgi:hypothetical protein